MPAEDDPRAYASPILLAEVGKACEDYQVPFLVVLAQRSGHRDVLAVGGAGQRDDLARECNGARVSGAKMEVARRILEPCGSPGQAGAVNPFWSSQSFNWSGGRHAQAAGKAVTMTRPRLRRSRLDV